MGSRAVAWLVEQYRYVLTRVRTREYLKANPQLSCPASGGSPLRRGHAVEQLENRTMLSVGGQVFYVDSQGARGVDYRGPVTVDDVDVPAFAAPGGLEGKKDRI